MSALPPCWCTWAAPWWPRCLVPATNVRDLGEILALTWLLGGHLGSEAVMEDWSIAVCLSLHVTQIQIKKTMSYLIMNNVIWISWICYWKKYCFSHTFFLSLRIYLFVRVSGRDRKRKWSFIQWFTPEMVSTKSGTRSFIPLSHMSCRGPSLWAIFHCFFTDCYQGSESKVEHMWCPYGMLAALLTTLQCQPLLIYFYSILVR